MVGEKQPSVLKCLLQIFLEFVLKNNCLYWIVFVLKNNLILILQIITFRLQMADVLSVL